MSDALNGSVASFCHSQDRLGGVPVAVLEQSAGLTGEDTFVQHQPLGRRTWSMSDGSMAKPANAALLELFAEIEGAEA